MRNVILPILGFAVWACSISCVLLLPTDACAVEWTVEIYNDNKNYLEVTLEAEWLIEKVTFSVALFDEKKRKIGERNFTFCDPDERTVSKGNHRKFFQHGVAGARFAKGIAMDFQYVTGVAFYDPSGEMRRQLAQLPRGMQRIEPEDDDWDEEPETAATDDESREEDED